MLTQERADMISQFLASDQERAKGLLNLEPEQALEKINSMGNDFTLSELDEYCKALKLAITDGELNTDELENVAGGVAGTIAVGALIGCGVAGFVAGFACNVTW